MAATAAQLWILMNAFPLVALTLGGQRQETTVIGAAIGLAGQGMPMLSLLVVSTAIVAPGVEIALALYLLWCSKAASRSDELWHAIRYFRTIRRWSMADVFMLGCLVSIVKLAHLAELVVGPALFACAVLLPALAFLNVYLRPERFLGPGANA